MVQDVIVTEAAHDFGRCIARKPFCCDLPVKAATIRVREVNPVVEFVEHRLEESAQTSGANWSSSFGWSIQME